MQKFLESKLSTILFLIILIGAFFRFYGSNWDQGYHLHPDERMITMVVEKLHIPQPLSFSTLSSPQSSLNPQFFPYGSFPLYLLKFTGWIFSSFSIKWSSYSYLNILGRFLSAAIDTTTILVIYLIGKKVWSRKVGLVASLFYSLSVFPIQAAHFYAVDSMLTFFITVTIYRLLIFYDKPTLTNSFFVGIFFGLSLATKISATVLVLAIGFTFVVDLVLTLLKKIRQLHLIPKAKDKFLEIVTLFMHAVRSAKKEKLIKTALIIASRGVFITVLAAATFVIFEPYAAIDFPTFWRQTQEQQAMTKSAYTFPYTLQYVGTTPYLYQIKNLILWGMGIPLGIASCAAVLWIILRLIIEIPRPGNENQEAKILILTVFCLAYFAVTGNFAIKFMRYLLPLYPILSLFAASFCFFLISKYKRVGKVVLYTTVTATLLWALSFSMIYRKPNTRVAATNWINQNIPQGSKIAVEHWDDQVPLAGNYQYLQMPMYDSDSSYTKWQTVNDNLNTADYFVLASNRLYVPLQKLSDCQKFKVCYPKMAKYYQDLFSGKLGFIKIAEFTNYPVIPLLNIKIVDDAADESFTVYDHPKVIVFKRSK